MYVPIYIYVSLYLSVCLSVKLCDVDLEDHTLNPHKSQLVLETKTYKIESERDREKNIKEQN